MCVFRIAWGIVFACPVVLLPGCHPISPSSTRMLLQSGENVFSILADLDVESRDPEIVKYMRNIVKRHSTTVAGSVIKETDDSRALKKSKRR